MNSDFETSIRVFFRRIFESNPDLESLTQAKLKRKYLGECQNEENKLNKIQNKLFKSVLNEFLLEYSERMKENELNSPEKFEMSTSLENDNENGSHNEDVETIKKRKSLLKKKRVINSGDSDSDALVIDESDEEQSEPTISIKKSNIATGSSKFVISKSSNKQISSSDPLSLVGASSTKVVTNDDMNVQSQSDNEEKDEIDSDISSVIDLSSSYEDNANNEPNEGSVHQLNSPVTHSSSSEENILNESPSFFHHAPNENENISKVPFKRKKILTKERKKPLKKKRLKESHDEESTSEEEEKAMVKIEKTKLTTTKFKTAKKPKIMSSDDDDEDNEENYESDVSENESKNEKEDLKQSKTNETKKEQKIKEKSNKPKLSAANTKIERLKRYIREAGIRIQSYPKLFQNCETLKSKSEKLSEILKDAGLKGKPNLQNCRKLKKKRERKQEVESLDLTNIIRNNGRSKRNNHPSNAKTSLPLKKKVYLKVKSRENNTEMDDDEETKDHSDNNEISSNDNNLTHSKKFLDSSDESSVPTKKSQLRPISNDEGESD